jgi:hypothetical protein
VREAVKEVLIHFLHLNFVFGPFIKFSGSVRSSNSELRFRFRFRFKDFQRFIEPNPRFRFEVQTTVARTEPNRTLRSLYGTIRHCGVEFGIGRLVSRSDRGSRYTILRLIPRQWIKN